MTVPRLLGTISLNDQHPIAPIRPLLIRLRQYAMALRFFGRFRRWFWLAIALGATLGGAPLRAEPIPADDGLGTIVTPDGDQFTITGGSRSSSGSNLFHGFEEFNLDAGQTATFLVDPAIQNVFSRIQGGDASVINGLIQLTGGTANLYLLNPAGIVFGDSGQVNVPGSFYATSANAVQFGLNWFNVFEDGDVSGLNGLPTALAFSPVLAGSILNSGTIGAGQQVALLGGTVLSTGSIASGANAVTVTAVEGDRVVRIQPVGAILSFDIGVAGRDTPTAAPNQPADTEEFTPLSLAELIAGPASDSATGVTITDSGAVQLTNGQTVNLEPGAALVTGSVNGQVNGAGLQVISDRRPTPGDFGDGVDPDDLPDDFLDESQDFASDFEAEGGDAGDFADLGPEGDWGDFEMDGDSPAGDGDFAFGEFEPDGELGPDGEFEPDGDFEPDGELGPDGEFEPDGDPDFDPDQLALLNEIEAGNWALDADFSDIFAEGNFDIGIDRLENTWKQQLNDYLGQDVQRSPVNSASIRELLSEIQRQTNSQTAMVYMMLQDKQTDLVVMTGLGEPIYRRVAVGRAEVLAAADQLRQAITNPVLRNGTAYLTAAQQLDRWLIAPIAADLTAQNVDTLLIAPDAGLRSLPWAALHDGQQFLVQRFALGMTPSVNLTDARYVSLKDAPVLAMGASEFPAGLNPLPAVPTELRTIAEERSQTATFLNDQFTIANLQAQRQRQPAPILHLATHGEFKPGQPVNSYIQFWGQERLTLDRLRDLSLNNPPVELLVLSACRTAVGDVNAELGFAGLAVQAGVKSALASLWYVSDEGTLALMSEFYRQLSIVPTKAQALRQAQLSMIEGRIQVDGNGLTSGARGPIPLPTAPGAGRSLAHPYYWASFVAIGSPW